MTQLEDDLYNACATARAYLIERGIKFKETVGRTIVLPMLNNAITHYDNVNAYDERTFCEKCGCEIDGRLDRKKICMTCDNFEPLSATFK